MSEQMRLIADIGGTHARFALAGRDGGLHHVQKLATDAHETFESAAVAYLAQVPEGKITSAAIAMAGPVRDGAGKLVNGTWRISEAAISALVSSRQVRLLNDLQAAALGTRHCKAVPLEAGRGIDHERPVLVIGIGTGVGGCLLVPGTDGSRTAIATEIGHGLLATNGLLATDQVFSAEALLSGTGLPTLRKLTRIASKSRADQTARTPQIIDFLASGGQEAAEFSAIYARLFARFAATAALTVGATGGVVLVGGMAERLFPLLPTTDLIEAFHLPGPMTEWLKAITINRVADDAVALKGLAMLSLD
ncbi:MAG: ROK family protein [Minwuia sp.]|nr:ROK family protein [Minwuia sp.]